MRKSIIKAVSFLFVCVFCSCNSNIDVNNQADEKINFDDETFASIAEESTSNLVIKEHYVSQKEEIIRILRGDKSVAIVKLGEPIVVAQAEDVLEWGYFQFPEIFFVGDGIMMVSWQMKPDSYTVYGEDSNARLISKDGGLTWVEQDKDYYDKDNSFIEFKDGNVLQFIYRDSRDTKQYSNFPNPVNSEPLGNRWFYKESELPEDLRGVYLEYWDKKTGKISEIHAHLDDPGLLRYSYSNDNLMPLLWNGDMTELEDGSLVGIKYPGYYQNADGKVMECGLSVYKSFDKGFNWKRIGKIPYQLEKGKSPESYVFNGGEGFNESSFVVLNDGTCLCVIRTGHNTPMYRSFSKDGGYSWSIPEPFISNGVCPNMLLLNNGVLVLSSGRPGVQLRFNIDGDGIKWTEPIEMLPFMNENGKYGNNPFVWPTCSYTCLLAEDDHTFYFVWSDFTRKDTNGEDRKAIMFRKVEVIKR